MAFLALASQKSFLNLQKNFLQFQLVSISNQLQFTAAQMGAIQKAYGSDGDCSNDADYIYYEQLDQQLSTEKDSVESQLTILENEISGLKTLVNNNIKSSCTLNMASGG